MLSTFFVRFYLLSSIMLKKKVSQISDKKLASISQCIAIICKRAIVFQTWVFSTKQKQLKYMVLHTLVLKL